MNKLLLTLSGAIIFLAFFCGITRDDVSNEKYLELARQKQFDCVGEIYNNGQPSGSCVLIADKYVISAAHIFIKSETKKETQVTDKGTITLYTPVNERLDKVSNFSFVFNNKRYKGKTLTVHPAYLDKKTKGDCDLAFIELTETVQGIKPAQLNQSFDELHTNVVGVGFGVSGIANKPEAVKPRQEKIAGENVIDSLGGYTLNGEPSLMFCDFDCPTNKNCNKLGEETPRPLEYICGGGDSGGGLFRVTDKGWELIGLCKGSSTNIDQLIKTGYYGQVMYWTRVSVFNDWIGKLISSNNSFKK